jgi:biopolymer transport protein ExbD
MYLILIWPIFESGGLMKINRQRREIKSIDLLPLINVVFLLILFVLIAGRPTTNHPQQIEVATSTQDSEYTGAAFAVWLKQDDMFYLSEGESVTLGELADYVKSAGIVEQGLPVELIADRRAHAKPLLAFRAAMAKAGVGEIRLKTQYEGAPQ